MNICSYIHPRRTFLPCSGVGRHINNLLLTIDDRSDISLRLLFSNEFLTKSNRLPENAPLKNIRFSTFPFKERLFEHSWKLVNYPKMDKYLEGVDWMFSPMDTRFPTKKIKTAITIHDIQAFEYNLPWSNTKEHKKFKRRWGIWIKKAINQADLVFTVSEYSKNRLVSLLDVSSKKIKISGNAIDKDFVQEIKSTKPMKSDYPYVIIIGGLRRKKGGLEVLKLAREIKKAWKELKFVIIGENDPELSKYAQAEENIFMHEMISDKKMISWMKGAFASVFLSWYEGFGLPVLESMACGLPVICSDQGSLPEVSGDSTLLVKPNETKRIVNYLIDLQSFEFRNELIQKGFINLGRYSWETCSNNVLNAMQKY